MILFDYGAPTLALLSAGRSINLEIIHSCAIKSEVVASSKVLHSFPTEVIPDSTEHIVDRLGPSLLCDASVTIIVLCDNRYPYHAHEAFWKKIGARGPFRGARVLILKLFENVEVGKDMIDVTARDFVFEGRALRLGLWVNDHPQCSTACAGSHTGQHTRLWRAGVYSTPAFPTGRR